MNDFDLDEITRVVARRLAGQLLSLADGSSTAPDEPVRQAETPAEEPTPKDERRARFRNELLAKLRQR